MSLHCSNCGAALRQEARSCDRCGATVAAGAQAAAASDAGGSPQPATRSGPAMIDEGQTQAAPTTIEADDGGQTMAMPATEEMDDEGHTRLLPEDEAALDEGQTRAAPTTIEADDGGQTMAMPAAEEVDDEGHTRLLPEDEAALDEGQTAAASTTIEADDGGQTMAMPAAEEVDDEHTRLLPQDEANLDEGQTVAVPEAGFDAEQTRAIPEADTISSHRSTEPPPQPEGVPDEGQTRALSGPEAADDAGLTRPMAEAGITLIDGQPQTAAGTTLIDGQPPPAPPSRLSKSGPATAPLRPTDLKPGHILHRRYRLERILGKGGFGAAYLAQDQTLTRPCVVKQMLLRDVTSPRKLEQYRANFVREANLLAQLNHPGHPNIPEIFDFFADETGNYLVMKYIEGQSLKDLIDRSRQPLPWRDVIRYGVDLCSALHYMHGRGDEPVIHRDIKPANIVLGADGRIWLLDFGLAKAQPVDDNGETEVTKAFGSLGYSPLEQWLGQAEPASDIYALGATLHHLLTGLNPATPFTEQFSIYKLQQLHGQFIPIRKVNRELPRPLEGIIASATGANPEQRPTAFQLQQQLDVFISGAKDTALFTFKSGQSARSRGKFVDLCDQYRREAIAYLYGGDFERWFRLTNRNDLAEAAVQGLKRGKNQRDGLEKFLKLVLPNLFLRRLGRAALHVGRGSVQFVLTGIVIILLLLVAGSFVAQLILQQAIGNFAWDFYALEPDRVTSYSEVELNEIVRSHTDFIFNRVQIDLQSGNQVDVAAEWGGLVRFEFPLTVELVDQTRPHFELTEINGLPLFLIADNLSRGINNGLERAFARAPVNFSSLETGDTALDLRVERTEWWNPPATPSPEAASGQAAAPTAPDRVTRLEAINELDRDIILEIDGERWSIPAGGAETIELSPGAHSYAVKYRDSEQLVGEGVKTWTLSSYELNIRQN